MMIVSFALKIWAVAAIIGALIPLLREQTWWLRAWTYARLQMFVILSVTAAIYVFIPGLTTPVDVILFMGLIVAALTCLRDIIPFTRLGRKQTPDVDPRVPYHDLRLMVGNVLMENDAFEDYLQQIRMISPDILFLVETNNLWRDRFSILEAEYPHHYCLPLEDFNGMLFYSRFPIVNTDERYLVQDHIPSLTIDLDVGHTQPLRFYGVHPRPPRPEDDTADLDKELGFIANEVGHLDRPVIVTGDLNDVGWSSTTQKFLRVSGLRDPRLGRGLYNSYNAKNPLVRWPLDHMFHSKHFALKSMRRLRACGSDHFPIVVDFALYDPAAEIETSSNL